MRLDNDTKNLKSNAPQTTTHKKIPDTPDKRGSNKKCDSRLDRNPVRATPTKKATAR